MNQTMTFERRLLWAGIGALALALPGLARAQNMTPAPLTAASRAVGREDSVAVGVGSQQVIDIGRSVTRIALGDPKIADVSNAGPGQLRILGLAQGSTDLVLFTRDGTRRIRLSVARPTWSEIGGDPPLLLRCQVRLVVKACIARDLARFAPEMSADVIDEWHEGAGVGGVCHEAVRHDDLMRGIDGDLPIVALYEPVAGRQDPAVWVSEVALRPVRSSAVLGT